MAIFYDEEDYAKAVKDLFGPIVHGQRRPGAPARGMSAVLFSRIIREIKRGPSKPCRVAGAVDLSDTRFKSKLEFRGIRFDDDLIADVATFSSLTFSDCEFRGKLALRHCVVRGTLSLAECRFIARGKARKVPRLFLEGSRIDGNLHLDMVALDGPCCLSNIVVGGALRAGGLRIVAPAGIDSVLLDNTRVAGAIALAPFGASAAPAPGESGQGRRSVLPGSISTFGATCHSFMLKSVDIGGKCSLSGLQVATSLESTDNEFGGELSLDHVDCGQVVTIRKCSIAGQLSLAGTRIAAQLAIGDSQLANVHFNGATIGSLWIGTWAPVTCTRIYATSTHFHSFVKMSRLVVKIAESAEPGASQGAPVEDSGMIEFEHCRFGGLFTTWPVIGVAEIDGWKKNNFVTVERGFSFTDCDVGGHLSLTRLHAGVAADAGFVRLDRTRLRGPLFISSPLAIARRRQVPQRTRRKAREIVNAGTEAGYRARMRSLSMREFTASAVELSGLDLVACNFNDDSGDAGSLLGDRMEIAGRFETYVGEAKPPPAGGWLRARANIGGALRLRAAKIGELHLDGDSFRQRHGCVASSSGVVLELADIGMLRVPRTEEPRAPELNGFPVPLDLSGMTVRNWSFHEDVDAETRAGADDFLDFLDNDENLHREVYKSVAASLRDAGRDDDAEQVLYAEEYRARWESRRPDTVARSEWPVRERLWSVLGVGPQPRLWGRRPKPWIHLGRLFEPFDRFFLQYRRNTINLLYAILALFGVSAFFVSSHPSNFEMSERSRLVLQAADGQATGLARGLEFQTDGRNVGPHPDHWSVWNTLWMATRYHVPIVSMAVEDEYTASNDNRLRFGFPWNDPPVRAANVDPGNIGFSAEDWFAWMSLLNWIMWPLLLTFALRRALRAD